MAFAKQIAIKYPTLKRKLTVAHMDMTPERYIERNLRLTLIITPVLVFGMTLMLIGMGITPLIAVPLLVVVAPVVFVLLMRTVDIEINKLAREIDKDVLFAGRFLLIKLNSGKPLMNAIIDASNSYGVANRSFKEIVRDIELGTPLEEALEKASRYSPSEKMRRILFQITNALKIGVDVTNFLEAILDEIAQDQLTEVQKYGRKLSGLTMFYMLFAIVIPSLGITMFITVAALVNIQADMGLLSVFLFGLTVVELAFITVFKTIRPNVNI